MKTEIWVSFNYGVWALAYSKTIELPFAPFIGLNIIFDDEMERSVTLENNDYCRTIISYNLEKNQFEINIINSWRKSISIETFDGIIEEFSSWEKQHNENIEDFRNLILINQ